MGSCSLSCVSSQTLSLGRSELEASKPRAVFPELLGIDRREPAQLGLLCCQILHYPVDCCGSSANANSGQNEEDKTCPWQEMLSIWLVLRRQWQMRVPKAGFVRNRERACQFLASLRRLWRPLLLEIALAATWQCHTDLTPKTCEEGDREILAVSQGDRIFACEDPPFEDSSTEVDPQCFGSVAMITTDPEWYCAKQVDSHSVSFTL